MVRAFFVFWVSFSVAISPCAFSQEPKKEEKKETKKDEKKEEKKDEKSAGPQLTPDWAASLATSLSASLTALFTIYNFPSNLKNAREALKSLSNFKTHQEEYRKAIDEVEAFTQKRPGLMAELTRTFNVYQPALDKLDAHVRGVFGDGGPKSLQATYSAIDADLEKLGTLPGAGRWKNELAPVIDAWKKDRAGRQLDDWINGKLRTKFFTEGPGQAWLHEYIQHQRELGAAYWLEKGSMVELDRWVSVTEGRTKALGAHESGWRKTLAELKTKETDAAKDFLREFATFTRDINQDIADPAKKFSVLLVWATREPGEFHTSDGATPKSLAATKLLAYSEGRCNEALRALEAVKAAARGKGSYWSIPGQAGAVVLPVVTGSAAVATGFITIRSFVRLLRPAPPKAEEPLTKQG